MEVATLRKGEMALARVGQWGLHEDIGQSGRKEENRQEVTEKRRKSGADSRGMGDALQKGKGRGGGIASGLQERGAEKKEA